MSYALKNLRLSGNWYPASARPLFPFPCASAESMRISPRLDESNWGRTSETPEGLALAACLAVRLATGGLFHDVRGLGLGLRRRLRGGLAHHGHGSCSFRLDRDILGNIPAGSSGLLLLRSQFSGTSTFLVSLLL